jgi:hypothetical protein
MGPKTFLEFTYKHLRLRALGERAGEKIYLRKNPSGNETSRKNDFQTKVTRA